MLSVTSQAADFWDCMFYCATNKRSEGRTLVNSGLLPDSDDVLLSGKV